MVHDFPSEILHCGDKRERDPVAGRFRIPDGIEVVGFLDYERTAGASFLGFPSILRENLKAETLSPFRFRTPGPLICFSSADTTRRSRRPWPGGRTRPRNRAPFWRA